MGGRGTARALSLQGHTDPAGFVDEFSGSHRYVLDYLTEEVLARQPEQVVRFLLETSVLDRLSGPLCDAVCDRLGSQQLLEQIERASLFLHPLDDVRGWWRYHHLFADLLRARLEHELPERVPQLHHAAAAWHAQHGFADDAVRHALAAGEVAWAARLVEQHVEALLRRSEGATLHRWLAAVPAESLRSRPRLCVAQAISAVLGGRVEAVEPLVAAAERAFAATGDEPHEPSVGRALSGLANVPAVITFLRAELARLRGDPEQAVAYDQQTLAHLSEVDWALRSHVAWNLAVADWLRGRLGQAEGALADVVAERRVAGEDYLAMRACYDLGQVQHAQGHLSEALATYRQGLEVAGDVGRQLPAAGMAHVGLAQVLYEQDELDAAVDHATRGVGLCRQLAFTQPLATGLALLARIRQVQGDPAGAQEAIRQAERVELSLQVVALLNPVPVQAARLALAGGEVAAAARWVQQRGLGADDELDYPREGEYMVLARVLLAQQEPERALGLLERLHAQAMAQGRTGSLIELRTLQALTLDATGDRAAALAALAEALTLACPEGHVRVFVDEGAPMASLLNRLAVAHRTGRASLPGTVRPDDVDRLLQAFQPGAPRAGRHPKRDRAAGPGPAELLSDRELQVLGLLAAGKSNPEIAEELVVVLDTVKKHVGHILDKLGAANRTQAVARARALGLLR